MTPVATSPAASRGATIGRPLRAGIPRRVSGPARRPQATPTLWRHLAELADSRLLVRLTRGRAWIAAIGVLLMGLVFVQVSMLRLNTGIGRDVATATQLERANQQLRNTVADLGATDRIAAAAQKYGMVMPAAGDVRYVHAGDATPADAARGIHAPAPVQQQPIEPVQQTPVVQTPVQQQPVTTASPPPAVAATSGGAVAGP